jgi:hypothetical protein
MESDATGMPSSNLAGKTSGVQNRRKFVISCWGTLLAVLITLNCPIAAALMFALNFWIPSIVGHMKKLDDRLPNILDAESFKSILKPLNQWVYIHVGLLILLMVVSAASCCIRPSNQVMRYLMASVFIMVPTMILGPYFLGFYGISAIIPAIVFAPIHYAVGIAYLASPTSALNRNAASKYAVEI